MRPLCFGLVWTLACIDAVWVEAASSVVPARTDVVAATASVPWDDLNERSRGLVHAVVDKPMLTGRGPTETFFCKPEQYQFFLDHPDRAVTVWRRLGAKCVGITPRGENHFVWVDENGSEIVWETIHRSATTRIWYAEGKVRPGPILPLVPVKALVVMTHPSTRAPSGGAVVQHRAELFVQTDSRAATVLTKMMGTSAQRVAEQGLGQLQLFFSGVSWYLQRHPDQAEKLLRPDDAPESAARK